MPEYDWRAVEAAGGRMASGRLEAASPEQALRQLQQRGLVPVAVQPAGAGAAAASPAPTCWPPPTSWR